MKRCKPYGLHILGEAWNNGVNGAISPLKCRHFRLLGMVGALNGFSASNVEHRKAITAHAKFVFQLVVLSCKTCAIIQYNHHPRMPTKPFSLSKFSRSCDAAVSKARPGSQISSSPTVPRQVHPL